LVVVVRPHVVETVRVITDSLLMASVRVVAVVVLPTFLVLRVPLVELAHPAR